MVAAGKNKIFTIGLKTQFKRKSKKMIYLTVAMAASFNNFE